LRKIVFFPDVDRLRWPIIFALYLVVLTYEYVEHVLIRGHPLTNVLTEVIFYSVVIVPLLLWAFYVIQKRQSELLRLKDFNERILYNAPLGIFTTDDKARITSANPAYLRMMGSTLEEAIGSNLLEMPTIKALGLDKHFRKALKGKPCEVYNLKSTSTTGKDLYLSVKCTPIKDDRARITGLLGIMEDVTKRAFLEEKIRRSEEKYRNLIQSSSDAIFVVERSTGRIIDINDAVCRMLKYPREEIIGTLAGSRVVPQQKESFRREFEKLKETGRLSAEFELVRKDGSIFPVEIKGSAFKDYLFNIVRDITKRKRSERALKNRAEREAAVAKIGELSLRGASIEELMDEAVKLASKALDSELCKILWLDKSGKFLRLVAGVGWKRDAVGNTTVSIGLDSQEGYAIKMRHPVIVKDLKKEKRFSGPKLLLDHRAVSGISVPMIYREKVYGVMGAHTRRRRKYNQLEVKFLQSIANVVTAAIARREAEEKLHRYAEELEQSNKLKDLFTDIMRHDLQNPVAVIKGMSEILKEETASKEVIDGLELIDSNAEKLLGMINNASKLAKLGSLKDLKYEEKDLREILERVAVNVGLQLKKKNMKIMLDGVGECYAEVHSSIEDVFINLISNAIKYGKENTDIIAGITDAGKKWRVYVKDSGKGVPDEYKEAIFNRFMRVPKEGVIGTGLGLAIVKRIVELHRGGVWVEDNPGGGSIFYVEIPKKRVKHVFKKTE
jgi:PAS domain S-box-containing protein